MNVINRLKTALLCGLVLTSGSLASDINLKVRREVLNNGLTVLLYENTQAPTVACRLYYATGSVHEKTGTLGLAHMLEHMLFKGTKKVGITDSVQDAKFIAREDSLQALMRAADLQGDSVTHRTLKTQYDTILEEHRKLFVKDELWRSYQEAGGTGLNAFTTDLATAYHVNLPRNKIELFFWLESDRMQNAVLREFYPERDVVREERRMRVDDSPTGRYFETLNATFFEVFPFRTPTIGYPAEIDQLTREKAEEHYRKYYKPNNAILVLAGDFNADSVMVLIHKYFDAIPRGETFEAVTEKEPPQVAEKCIIVRRNDAKPRVDIMFHTPGIPNDDLFALDVVEGVLNGPSGRLHKRLVDQAQVAVSADAGNEAKKYYSSFELEAVLKDGQAPEKADALIWDELERLKKEPVTEHELRKVINQLTADKAEEYSNMESVANTLAFFEIDGDYTLMNRWVSEVAKVTPAKVQEVARKYFQHSLSTTGYLLPETK